MKKDDTKFPCSSTVDSRVVNLYVYPLPLFDVYLGHPSVLRSLTRLLLGCRSLKKLEYFKESFVIYKYKTLVFSPTHNPAASYFLCAFLCCLQCGYLVWSFLARLWVLIPPCIKVLDQDPNSCSGALDNLEPTCCGLICIRLMILLLKPTATGEHASTSSFSFHGSLLCSSRRARKAWVWRMLQGWWRSWNWGLWSGSVSASAKCYLLLYLILVKLLI